MFPDAGAVLTLVYTERNQSTSNTFAKAQYWGFVAQMLIVVRYPKSGRWGVITLLIVWRTLGRPRVREARFR